MQYKYQADGKREYAALARVLAVARNVVLYRLNKTLN